MLEGDRERSNASRGVLSTSGVHPYEFTPEQLGEATHAGDVLLSVRDASSGLQARAGRTFGAAATAPRTGRRSCAVRTSPHRHQRRLQLYLVGAARTASSRRRGWGTCVPDPLLCADVLAGFFLILALRSMRLPMGWLIDLRLVSGASGREAYCDLQRRRVLVMPAPGRPRVVAVARATVKLVADRFALAPGHRPAPCDALAGARGRRGAGSAAVGAMIGDLPWRW